MWYVECVTDGVTYTLLDLRNPIHSLEDPMLSLGANKTGSFTFTIYPNHPAFGHIKRLKSRVRVYRVMSSGQRKWLFTGRPVNSEDEFQMTGKVTCEGILALLLDSRIRPYDYSGTTRGYFTSLINSHNSFVRNSADLITLRAVAVLDSNDYIVRASSSYPRTLDELMSKTVNEMGGYLRVEEDEGVLYLDYLENLPHNTQKIRFGVNLTDFKRIKTCDGFFTALIPEGAVEESGEDDGESETRVSILHYCPATEPEDWQDRFRDYCTLSDGVYTFVTGDTAPVWQTETYYYGYDYVYDPDLVAEYGYIFAYDTWDDVTLPSNLYPKAMKALSQMTMTDEITVTAEDLSLSDETVASLHPGLVTISSGPHLDGDLDLMISEMTVPLLRPWEATFTIGGQIKTFTNSGAKEIKALEKKVEESRSYMDQLKEEIKDAKGLYSTTVTQQDGSVIHYWHNAPVLEDSLMIIQASTAGIHLTANGGSTWYGVNFNGRAILDMIYAVGIDAGYITTGSLNADLITAGRITDVTGNNYWDLDTGDFSMTGIATQAYANNAAASAANTLDGSLDQSEIFDRLTNNGTVQGLIMQNGQLYINASYINSGTLAAGLLRTGIITDAQHRNYWNLDTGDISIVASGQISDETLTAAKAYADEKDATNLAAAKTYADGTASSALSSSRSYTDALNNALTQLEIFNRLTNNGAAQGIVMQNGQLYINASFINTGTLLADLLVTGTIQDATGNNYWNLDNGEFHLSGLATETYADNAADSAATEAYDNAVADAEAYADSHDASNLSTAKSYADTKDAANLASSKQYADLQDTAILTSAKSYADSLDDALTQAEIFNRLTNNGAVQGIVMANGQLYINASYINSGTLNANLITAGYIVAGTVGGWAIEQNRIYRNTTLTVDGVEYVYQVGLQSANDESGTNNFLYVRRYKASQGVPSSASGWEYVSRMDKYGGVITSRLHARPSLQSGRTTITPSAANTPTSVKITFEQEMNAIPHVVATVNTDVPGTAVLGCGVTDVTAKSFKLWLTCTSTTTRTVHWIAHTDGANYTT